MSRFFSTFVLGLAMAKLLIQHLADSEPAEFQVVRASDHKAAPAAVVAGPVDFPVDDMPQSDLRRELRWYLEEFLDYPYPPLTVRAEAVKRSLRDWGKQAFLALFDNLDAGGFLQEAIGDDLRQLQLEIVSDDARVLAWPWEALYDPKRQTLAHQCQVVRRLNGVADPPKLPKVLPRDIINILLITARPYDDDVNYRSISRPLVDLVEAEKLPAKITVLRPPTLSNLRRYLEEHPDTFHIVHFDGHGAYMGNSPPNHHALTGPQGQLVFEQDDGTPDSIPADKLSLLLAEYKIPAVVLNACQSGMIDAEAEDAFASVATSLLRAGVRSVLAMAYSVYVSAAQEFLPEFYRRLFKSGSFTEATRAGRQQLLASQGRISPRGRFDLDDWVVPVVYEQQPPDLSFAATAERPAAVEVPKDVCDAGNPYGFIGRDGELLQMERAMHAAPAGILIHGLGGIGKTTLAMGFARWLIKTGGIAPERIAWFRFDESLRSAEYIINRLGEPLFGAQFVTADLEQRLDTLTQELKQHRLLVIWDNFEVACGIEGTDVRATLTTADQDLLKRFLEKLRGGRTKVLITSRSEEDWLTPANRRKITIGGMRGEERWDFCDEIIKDLAHKPDREDPALADLMNQLNGHPLAMRVVLTLLEDRSPAELAQHLAANIASFAGSSEAEQQLFGALRFVEEGLPAELHELLTPLALHERFVNADYLEAMAKQVDENWSRAKIDRFFQSLCPAGLLRDIGQAVFEMHPLLSSYLAQRIGSDESDRWTATFVDFMGRLADSVTPKKLHEQRMVFFVHGANFHRALAEAQRLEMDTDFAALTQSLAAYAMNTRDFDGAEKSFRQLADHQKVRGNEEAEAVAYHQLGMVDEERRQLEQAETWYKKSLEIKERLGNEHGAANTYHQLGIIDQKRRQLEQAETWYKKSLKINERLGDELGAASTYHQLGVIDQERRQFDQAEAWHKKSLEINERLGVEQGAASTYHQLGRIDQERRQFDQAEKWYKKSLEINERLGNEQGAAMTFGQLGLLSEQRGQLNEALEWTIRAGQGFAGLNDDHRLVITMTNYVRLARKQLGPVERAKLASSWLEAGLPAIPEEVFDAVEGEEE